MSMTKHGYNIKVLCEHQNARSKEVKSYFRGQFGQIKIAEFNREIQKLGIQ